MTVTGLLNPEKMISRVFSVDFDHYLEAIHAVS